MTDDLGKAIGGFIAAILSLAVLAIVISARANTVNVISSFFSGVSNLIGVAISPVTGQTVSGLSAQGLQGGTWATSSGSGGGILGTGTSGLAPSATGFLSNVTGLLSGNSNSGLGNVLGGANLGGANLGGVIDAGSF